MYSSAHKYVALSVKYVEWVTADSSEDRKRGNAGQRTTIVSLGQDAPSHCSRGYPPKHSTNSTILASYPLSDSLSQDTPLSQTLAFQAVPNRNDANMQL